MYIIKKVAINEVSNISFQLHTFVVINSGLSFIFKVHRSVTLVLKFYRSARSIRLGPTGLNNDTVGALMFLRPYYNTEMRLASAFWYFANPGIKE